jgi:secreted Zn-dependent insulinase-like peptidase
MSEEQQNTPTSSFGFPKSTPKKLQEEIEKLIPKELHEQAIVILRDNEKQSLRDVLSTKPYKLTPNMVAMLMKNYYSHGCDTATILDKASQLAKLISKGK